MKRLPTEIFFKIFELLASQHCENTGFVNFHDSLVDTMLVCHQWHQMIISNPKIWSRISIFSHRPRILLIQTCLTRSQTVPLDICLHLHSGASCGLSPGDSCDDVAQIIQLVCLHQWRIGSFQIRAASEGQLRHALLALNPQFPALKKLRCEVHSASTISRVEIRKLELPLLQDLYLCKTPSVWGSLVVKNLRRLTIASLYNGIYMKSLFSLLAATPDLKHLDIFRITSPHAENPIILLQLDTLIIRQPAGVGMLAIFLSRFIIPNLCTLYINCEAQSTNVIEPLGHLPYLKHLSLLWIKPERDLLPQLAIHAPNLQSLMLSACFSLAPLPIQFLGRLQPNGQLPFPHLTTVIFRRVKLARVVELVLARPTIKEVFLFSGDHYATGSNKKIMSQHLSQLRQCVKVVFFWSRTEDYEPDVQARKLMFKGDLIWPDLRGCDAVCIEDYLEDTYGINAGN